MKILTVSVGLMVLSIASPVHADDGATIYSKKCLSCHGADGKGDTKMGQKLKCRDLSKVALTDAKISKAITDGVTEDGKLRMKPVKGLSEADIAAVVKYLQTLKK